MTAPVYLAPSDYTVYGVADASYSQVFAASRRIDAHLGRPEGLLYSSDANGLPAYMTGKSPNAVYTLTTSLTAGTDLTVALPNAAFTAAAVGEVVILDRSNNCEACVVTAATANTVTLANVQFGHSTGATLEFGLTLAEDRTLYAGAYRLRLARSPVVRILSAAARFGDSAVPPTLSGPGFGAAPYFYTASSWAALDLNLTDFNAATGALDLLPGRTTPGSAARVRYVAGWTPDTLPTGIKQATANLIRAAIDLPSGIKTQKAGDGTITRFSPTTLDPDTSALLAPYRTPRL